MKRMRLEDLGYPGDGRYYDGDKPFTGVGYYLSDAGGWLEAEEEYRDGVKWGRKRVWFRPGALQEDAECACGAYHGRVRQWYENGRLAADSKYEYGVRIEGKGWDEAGNLIEEYQIPEEERPWVDTCRKFLASGGESQSREGFISPRTD
jgi:antitoxin component YwqK of YwqJK toxin-antitoxin module